MPEDEIVIITMDDMALVFEVTDAFGIHRESVSVELAREDPGGVDVDGRGMVEITLPVSTAVADYAGEIRSQLEARGYQYDASRIAAEANGDGDDEEDDWLG
jgi:hypothetical protein